MQSHTKNFYELLGVTKDAQKKDIDKARRERLRNFNADHQVNSKRKDTAEEYMKDINDAYAVLVNPVSRQGYDSQLETELQATQWEVRQKEQQEWERKQQEKEEEKKKAALAELKKKDEYLKEKSAMLQEYKQVLETPPLNIKKLSELSAKIAIHEYKMHHDVKESVQWLRGARGMPNPPMSFKMTIDSLMELNLPEGWQLLRDLVKTADCPPVFNLLANHALKSAKQEHELDKLTSKSEICKKTVELLDHWFLPDGKEIPTAQQHFENLAKKYEKETRLNGLCFLFSGANIDSFVREYVEEDKELVFKAIDKAVDQWIYGGMKKYGDISPEQYRQYSCNPSPVVNYTINQMIDKGMAHLSCPKTDFYERLRESRLSCFNEEYRKKHHSNMSVEAWARHQEERTFYEYCSDSAGDWNAHRNIYIILEIFVDRRNEIGMQRFASIHLNALIWAKRSCNYCFDRCLFYDSFASDKTSNMVASYTKHCGSTVRSLLEIKDIDPSDPKVKRVAVLIEQQKKFLDAALKRSTPPTEIIALAKENVLEAVHDCAKQCSKNHYERRALSLYAKAYLLAKHSPDRIFLNSREVKAVINDAKKYFEDRVKHSASYKDFAKQLQDVLDKTNDDQLIFDPDEFFTQKLPSSFQDHYLCGISQALYGHKNNKDWAAPYLLLREVSDRQDEAKRAINEANSARHFDEWKNAMKKADDAFNVAIGKTEKSSAPHLKVNHYLMQMNHDFKSAIKFAEERKLIASSSEKYEKKAKSDILAGRLGIKLQQNKMDSLVEIKKDRMDSQLLFKQANQIQAIYSAR